MNRILLYFSFICTVGLACCTRTPDEKLFVVEDNGLFGYVSESGDTVIPCMYPFAYTDTIKRIGFVAEGNGKIACLDKKAISFLTYSNMTMDPTTHKKDYSES